MATSCEIIPKKRGSVEQSTLFKELLNITNNNREFVKQLWGVYKDDALMQHLGIPIITEPSAAEFLDKTGLEDSLDTESYARYVSAKENLDTVTYKEWNDATNTVNTLSEKYKQNNFIISDNGEAYKVTVLPKTRKNTTIQIEQNSLSVLNTRILNYMQNLGFAVDSVGGLEQSGKFSPLNAKTNADGLISIIQLSKGIEGQKALPEEFAHFVVEGTQKSPLTQRLINLLSNSPELLKSILGDSYGTYNELYEADGERLAREAAAKLVAQHLANREGLQDSVSYLSNRWLNYVASIFEKGDETEVQDIINETDNITKSLVDDLYSGSFIEYFDKNAVLTAKEMYMVQEKVRNLESITKNAQEKLGKRIKILNLNKVNGKFTEGDILAFDELEENIAKEKYAEGIAGFLNYALIDVQDLYQRLSNMRDFHRDAEVIKPEQLKAAFSLLHDFETVLSAYDPIIRELSAISEISEIANELPLEEIKKIEDAADSVKNILDRSKETYKDFRIASLLKFYQPYWGEDKMFNGKTITLVDVLESTVGDTNVFGRLINSMSNMPDPLLQMVDMVYKDQVASRDAKLFDLRQRLGAIHREYVSKTGSRDTSFVFVMKDGKPTGYLISPVDYTKYYQAKHAYYETLKDKGYSSAQISAKLRNWVLRNTNPLKEGGRIPKQSLYPSDDLNKLSTAQRQYYDQMLEVKKELELLLPKNRRALYRAVQKRISSKDAILTKGNLKSALKHIKDTYITQIDDTEYGETVMDDKGQYVLLDFAGKEVKKVPIFYTTFLDDMSMLDTNFTDALLSYGAMAYNYRSMMNIADVMEVTASQMNDRRITQTVGKKKLYERFKINDKAFQSDYTTLGANSELAKKLRNYIDANIYNRKKAAENITVGNTQVNAGKLGDALVRYNSLVGLGYNLFSGTTNISMGFAQTMIHAFGRKNFGFKDVAKAHIWYNKDLAGCIADQYKDIKTNKLSLLIDRFDALEEFYEQLNDTNYYGGVFKKVVGKHSPLVFNSMGEHYLHAIGMLAILNNTKVILNGKSTSLYNALEVKEIITKEGHKVNHIVIAEGTKKEDGSNFTENDLNQLKLEIQDANHRMHGAFNQTDIGDLNRNAIGRLVKQFRQWMPAFFMDRFKSNRINMVTGKEEEGFYVSAAKTILGFLNDFRHLNFNVATRWKTLSREERANLRMALFEVGLLYMIVGMLKYMGGPDKDDPAYVNMFKYNLYRLKMELGAAAPTSKDFLVNWTTLIRTPVPAMETTDRLIRLLDLSTMFEEVQSGRYEGWNRWLRNLYFSVPYARNVGRFVDLVEGETSMFTPYIKGTNK